MFKIKKFKHKNNFKSQADARKSKKENNIFTLNKRHVINKKKNINQVSGGTKEK